MDLPGGRNQERAVAETGAGSSVAAAFDAAAAAHPDQAALSFLGGTRTLGDLVHEGHRLANGLAALGVTKGDRVSVFAANRAEHVTTFLAVARLGALVAPVNPQWTAREAGVLLRDAEPTVILTDSARASTARDAAAGLACHHVALPGSDDADVAYAELLDATPVDHGDVHPDDPLAIWYTSGTTGRPKGAVWSHRTVLFNGLAWMDALGIEAEDVGIKATPMAHNGLGFSVLAPMLRGGRVQIHERVDPTAILADIGANEVTWMVQAPAVLQLLRQRAAELGITTLPSLRLLALGGAKPSRELLGGVDLFPNAPVWNSYGASEAHVSACRAGGPTTGSVGRPFAGMDVAILDEDGHAVGRGVVGRVAVRGPGTMQGYWNRPELTAAATCGPWTLPGDLGCLDDDDNLHLEGREADMINTGGYLVHASEIEAVLLGHPAVAAVAVVGRPDDLLGTRPEAHVVLHPGDAGARVVRSLEAQCRAALARYKRPHRIHVAPSLPTNSMGKVQKHRIPAPRSLYSDAEEHYRRRFRDFVAGDPPPELLHNEPAEIRALLAWFGRLGVAGLACLHWPSDAGGAGLPIGFQLVQQEELAALGVPHRPLMIGLSMTGPLLLAHGTPAQRERHLSAIREGRELWTQLFSEPDAGSDLAGIRTTATVEGDQLVLRGAKVWSSYAHVADWGLALVRVVDVDAAPSDAAGGATGRAAGIAVVLVSMDTPGIEVRPLRQITGDAEFCEVRFDEVRIPRADLVGAPGSGWAGAMQVLNSERTAIGLSYYAKLTVELEELERTLRARTVPGPTRDRVAALHASVVAQRLTAIRFASGLERGLDFGPLASLGKLHATRNWQELAALRIELLGADATAPGTAVADRAIRDLLDTRSLAVGGGTTEIQKSTVGERVLGLPR